MTLRRVFYLSNVGRSDITLKATPVGIIRLHQRVDWKLSGSPNALRRPGETPFSGSWARGSGVKTQTPSQSLSSIPLNQGDGREDLGFLLAPKSGLRQNSHFWQISLSAYGTFFLKKKKILKKSKKNTP